MAGTDIVKLYPTDAETSSIHKWAATAMDAQSITVLKGMSKGDVALIAFRGFELGIGMMHALDSLYVVNGRVSMSAELMRERAINAGYRIRIVSEDADHCTISIHHITEPDDGHEETFLMSEAKNAGLAGKDNWKNWPKAMMRARATASAVRWFAPQALAGCVERGEAEDIPEAFTEPRVLSADEAQDAEQRGQDFVEAHTTLDANVAKAITDEITQIVAGAALSPKVMKKAVKDWTDFKLETFGVKDAGLIPASGEAETRRYVQELKEKLSVAPEAAEGVVEIEEAPTPTEPVEEAVQAPEREEDIPDADFEEEPVEEDSGTGYNTEAWTAEKVPVMEFSRWMAKRYEPEAQSDLLAAAGVEKPGIAHLTAGERFMVFEYVSQQPEQGDLFGEEAE